MAIHESVTVPSTLAGHGDLPRLLARADRIRRAAANSLEPARKSPLAQFFTPTAVARFMASLFESTEGQVRLLDPGCGSGALTAAFVAEALERGATESLDVDAVDVDPAMALEAKRTLDACEAACAASPVSLRPRIRVADFLCAGNRSRCPGDGVALAGARYDGLFPDLCPYTHVIANPPYGKIRSDSVQRRALRSAGVEATNLYAGFVALALRQLIPGGELVAIVPRSFCNGPYFRPFRELLFREAALRRIHLLESRTLAFRDDDVLQETVIIHAVKGARQCEVVVSASPGADFRVAADSRTAGARSWYRRFSATGMSERKAPFRDIVAPDDPAKLIRIAPTAQDQEIVDRFGAFTCRISDLETEVSTGPVVEFRHRADLVSEIDERSVPLLFPAHLAEGRVRWPIQSSKRKAPRKAPQETLQKGPARGPAKRPRKQRKPNAIRVSDRSLRWLWPHQGHFVVTRRFSAKEERRRVVAAVYDSGLPGALIGFDNKLNVFHHRKAGFGREKALGLATFLNSTLVDRYYRLFGGHTQVNASDLRSLRYPSNASLVSMGRTVAMTDGPLTQSDIDAVVEAATTVDQQA